MGDNKKNGSPANNFSELSQLSEIDELPMRKFVKNGARRVSQWNMEPIDGAEWSNPNEQGQDWGQDSCPLFIELLELVQNVRGRYEWRESARWIKYEECVEKASERWSKPYVPSLNYPSVQLLRNSLLNHAVDLDLGCTDLPSIFRHVTDEWGHPELLQLLTRRYVHLYERRRDHSVLEDVLPPVYGNKKEVERSRKKSQSAIAQEEEAPHNCKSKGEIDESIKKKCNLSFLKKLPADVEACSLLIGYAEHLEEPLSAFVRLKSATLLGNITEVAVPTRFLFVALVPKNSFQDYLQVGRSLGALISDPDFKETAYKASTHRDLVNGLDKFLAEVTLLPPAGWDSKIRIEPVAMDEGGHGAAPDDASDVVEYEGLARTGRLFGGLWQDIKRKVPWYPSDFRDALSLQCLATWLFLYFACLTPMITFGGMLGDATHNQMGTMEVMVAGCLCGVVFAIFSGQPLLILGSTGPMLIFEKIIVQVTDSFEFEYMEFRVWIGIWVGVILLILVATDASAFVKYITRFTEENFATLVAAIFIYEAVKNLLHIKDPVGGDGGLDNETTSEEDTGRFPEGFHEQTTERPSSALFQKSDRGTIFLTSVILFFATFVISFALKEFRSTRFLPTRIRYLISDFAVIIAIIAVSALDFLLAIETPKLNVPEKFAPTLPERGWLINPIKHNQVWTIGVAIVPALLACILIFMDQQITAVIINRKDHKLKKGSGYHLDLLVLAVLIVTCSFLGLPWFIAATVESLTNLNSLKMESESTAPGEKPKFLGVREQRVTNILVFTTVGLSVLLTSLLKYVPMPVLYGVFLYMGISALRRMELYERLLLFFMPVKYQPDKMYLRNVRITKVHLYTSIQLISLVVLWVIKSVQVTSIGFPLMLLVMMLLRKLLEYIFTLDELASLDDLLPGTKPKKSDDDEAKPMERLEHNGKLHDNSV